MAEVFRQVPMVLDIEFRRGDSVRIPISIEENVGTSESPAYQALDLTDLTFSAQLRRKPNDSDPVAVFGVVDADLLAGTFALKLTAEESAKVSREAVWDLQSTDNVDGSIRTWVAGTARPQLDVTRP